MRTSHRIGIHLSISIIAGFDIMCCALHQCSRTLNQLLVADDLSDFLCSSTSRPLEEVGVTMVVGEIPELPDTCILFIDCLFDFLQDIINSTPRVGPLFENETVVCIQ